jgi:hypothetical protein
MCNLYRTLPDPRDLAIYIWARRGRCGADWEQARLNTQVYFRYTPVSTNFTFEFIRRPVSPILSPSSRTFVELTPRQPHLGLTKNESQWFSGYPVRPPGFSSRRRHGYILAECIHVRILGHTGWIPGSYLRDKSRHSSFVAITQLKNLMSQSNFDWKYSGLNNHKTRSRWE